MCVQLEEAGVLSQRVASMGEEAREFLPRAYLSLGLCHSLQASDGEQTNNPHMYDGCTRRLILPVSRCWLLFLLAATGPDMKYLMLALVNQTLKEEQDI